MKVGVLALQGDFREHLLSLENCGVTGLAVKRHDEISQVDALIIPGGESTTISKLAKTFGLFELIRDRISSGMPVYGSCAGMILLSREIIDPASGQDSFGGLDIVVRRNAFGKQVDSFESDLDFKGIEGGPVRAVFIRAPWVESHGPEVEILASVQVSNLSPPVAVRQGNVFATSFHPEISGDFRVHKYFIDQICSKAQK